MSPKLLALLLPALLFEGTRAFDDFMEEALMMDDECQLSDGEEACAVQALQIKSARAAKEKAEAAEGQAEAEKQEFQAETEAGEEESFSVKWVMGTAGQSCAMVCRGAHAMCSDADLRSVKDWQQVWQAASQAGGQCRMSWANDGRHGAGFANAPLICNAAMCGADSKGTCTYDTSGRSSCAGQPAPGFSRLCPCKTSGGYMPSTPSTPSYVPSTPTHPGSQSHPGTPSSPTYPGSQYHPGTPTPSMPYHPMTPSPSHHGSSSSHSTTKTCKTMQTGGSCSFFGCAKSRGVGVKCEKKKCVCKPGYCAMKGVCRKM